MGVRRREVFMFEGGENGRIWSGEDITTIFRKEGKVEMMEVFESKTSLRGFKMEEIPVN